MKDKLVYITLDNWNTYRYSDKVKDFFSKLENGDVDVNCNILCYDMAFIYYFTTTEDYIKDNKLDFLKNYIIEKTNFHPEYDLSKIGTKNNYIFLN